MLGFLFQRGAQFFGLTTQGVFGFAGVRYGNGLGFGHLGAVGGLVGAGFEGFAALVACYEEKDNTEQRPGVCGDSVEDHTRPLYLGIRVPTTSWTWWREMSQALRVP